MRAGWISLTFDDALHEHLDHVVPLLNDYGLRGTFYTHLCSEAFINRQADWRRAANQGHEIGNHTIFHPADGRKHWVRPGNAIESYSLDRMQLELEFSSQFLTAMDGRERRTFAYPCSNSFIGRRGRIKRLVERIGLGRTRVAGWIDRMRFDWGSTLKSYEPIVGQLFAAGRGGGLSRGQAVPELSKWRRTQLPSVAVENWTLSELQEHVTNALNAETWAIFQFHGVGGGHRMDCDLRTFREFVMWLNCSHVDRVLTVMDGADRLWPDPKPAPALSNARLLGQGCSRD